MAPPNPPFFPFDVRTALTTFPATRSDATTPGAPGPPPSIEAISIMIGLTAGKSCARCGRNSKSPHHKRTFWRCTGFCVLCQTKHGHPGSVCPVLGALRYAHVFTPEWWRLNTVLDGYPYQGIPPVGAGEEESGHDVNIRSMPGTPDLRATANPARGAGRGGARGGSRRGGYRGKSRAGWNSLSARYAPGDRYIPGERYTPVERYTPEEEVVRPNSRNQALVVVENLRKRIAGTEDEDEWPRKKPAWGYELPPNEIAKINTDVKPEAAKSKEDIAERLCAYSTQKQAQIEQQQREKQPGYGDLVAAGSSRSNAAPLLPSAALRASSMGPEASDRNSLQVMPKSIVAPSTKPSHATDAMNEVMRLKDHETKIGPDSNKQFRDYISTREAEGSAKHCDRESNNGPQSRLVDDLQRQLQAARSEIEELRTMHPTARPVQGEQIKGPNELLNDTRKDTSRHGTERAAMQVHIRSAESDRDADRELAKTLQPSIQNLQHEAEMMGTLLARLTVTHGWMKDRIRKLESYVQESEGRDTRPSIDEEVVPSRPVETAKQVDDQTNRNGFTQSVPMVSLFAQQGEASTNDRRPSSAWQPVIKKEPE